MGYYTRVFCRSEKSPAFFELQEYMRNCNPLYRLEGDVDDKNRHWSNFDLFYKSGKHPIPVELNWCEEESSVGKEELAEFLDEIGPVGWSLKTRKVIKLLKHTKYIICNQLLSDLDDDGYRANDSLLRFFADNYQGMIHAENEGFYSSDGIFLLKDS